MNNHIIILGSKNYANKRIAHELKELGHRVAIVDPVKFTLFVSDKRGHDYIYYQGRRLYASHISAVVSRVGRGLYYASGVLDHFSQNMGVFVTATGKDLMRVSDKFKCAQIMSRHRVPVPKQVHFKKPRNYQVLFDLVGGLPCIAKITKGSRGKGVFYIDNYLAGKTALDTVSINEKVLLQEFIETAEKENAKTDIRVWVIDGEVKVAMKRYSEAGDVRSNYTLSKKAEKVELTEEQEEVAIKAAKATSLPISAVDLMIDVETKKAYCIENNGNGGFKIEKVTQYNLAKDIADYVDRNVTARKAMAAREIPEQFKAFEFDTEDTSFKPKPFLEPQTEEDDKEAEASGESLFSEVRDIRELNSNMKNPITKKAMAIFNGRKRK